MDAKCNISTGCASDDTETAAGPMLSGEVEGTCSQQDMGSVELWGQKYQALSTDNVLMVSQS